MKPRSDDPLDRLPESPRPQFPVWIGTLAPPIAAILHLQFMYVLEQPACSTQSKLGLHIISIALLSLDLLGGFVAHREWMKFGADVPGQLPGPLGSRRLLALFGMIGAFIFGLFILAQWFPTFVLPECVRT